MKEMKKAWEMPQVKTYGSAVTLTMGNKGIGQGDGYYLEDGTPLYDCGSCSK